MAWAIRKYRRLVNPGDAGSGQGMAPCTCEAQDGAAPFLGARHQDSACGVLVARNGEVLPYRIGIRALTRNYADSGIPAHVT